MSKIMVFPVNGRDALTQVKDNKKHKLNIKNFFILKFMFNLFYLELYLNK